MTEVSDLPKGGQITGHLTAANTGRIDRVQSAEHRVQSADHIDVSYRNPK